MVMSYSQARDLESRLRDKFGDSVRADVTGGLPEDPETFDLEEAKQEFQEQLDEDEDRDYDGPDPHGDPWLDVDADVLHDVIEYLKNTDGLEFDSLHNLGGDHWADRGQIVVVYHLYSFDQEHWAILKVFLSEDEPIVPSITDLYPGADWHEREAYDMLGIRFVDHPDLRRILLPPDWDGHPLRKDYQFPQFYRGLPVDWDEARDARMSRDDFYDEAQEIEEMDIDEELGFPSRNGD